VIKYRCNTAVFALRIVFSPYRIRTASLNFRRVRRVDAVGYTGGAESGQGQDCGVSLDRSTQGRAPHR
jgi:hypothetical protein